MLFDNEPISDVGSLLSAVERHHEAAGPEKSSLWYRGCTSTTHSLVPSIGRPPSELHHEQGLINMFKQERHPVPRSPPGFRMGVDLSGSTPRSTHKAIRLDREPAHRPLFRDSLCWQPLARTTTRTALCGSCSLKRSTKKRGSIPFPASFLCSKTAILFWEITFRKLSRPNKLLV